MGKNIKNIKKKLDYYFQKGGNKMSKEFEEKHHHFGSGYVRGYFRHLLDSQKALKEIGLEEGNTLLDAGCGEGRFSIPASEIVGDNGKVYAVDSSEEAISSLKEEIKKKDMRNIKAFVGDITKRLPIEDEEVDVCLMANILHGLVVSKKIESALKEIFRVLKPNGTLAIIDFKKIDGPPGPPKSIRMTPEEVERIISKYGFKKKRVAEIGEYHYAVIFVKDFNEEYISIDIRGLNAKEKLRVFGDKTSMLRVGGVIEVVSDGEKFPIHAKHFAETLGVEVIKIYKDKEGLYHGYFKKIKEEVKND